MLRLDQIQRELKAIEGGNSAHCRLTAPTKVSDCSRASPFLGMANKKI
jgi:hypothetical protein